MTKLLTIAGTITTVILIVVRYLQPIRVAKEYKSVSVIGDDQYKRKSGYIVQACIILGLGLFLRIWQLNVYPAGINCDEIGMAYDAYCLSNYGVDRFMNPYPLYLINYGGGQSAVYAMLCVPLFKLFGVSLYTVRMPAVIAGFSVILLGGCIAKRLCGEKTALWTMLLTAFCPYYITSSRIGFDCNLFLCFSMLSFLMLIQAVRIGKKRFYVVAGLLYGFTLYTYSLSWIIVPLFLIIAAIYLIYLKQSTWKQLAALAGASFFMAIPLFVFLFINTFELEPIITSSFSIPILPVYRAGEFSFTNLDYAVKAIRLILTTDQSQFFAYDAYYTLYAMSIPFILLGFWLFWKRTSNSVRNKRPDAIALVFLFCAAGLVNAVLLDTPNIYRNNSMYFPIALFAAAAVVHVCEKYRFKRIIYTVLLGLYGLHLVSFVRFYYSPRVEQTYPVVWFSYDYIDDIYKYLHENDVQTEIYVDDMNMTTYCYAMVEYEVSPYEFAEEGNDAETNQFHYKNLHFYLPDELEQISGDKIYIVMEQNPYNDNFVNLPFQMQKYGYFNIYY